MTSSSPQSPVEARDVLTKMRHDIGQPIRAVQLLTTQLLGATSADMSASISRSLEELRLDVDSLVDYVVLLEGASSTRTGDLSHVVADAIANIDPAAKQANVELIFDDPISNQPVITGVQPCRALINALLQNAIDFSPGGSVAIEATHDANWVNLSIRDTGVGILPQDRKDIFRPYVARRAHLSSRPRRWGLGLATASLAAQAIGATLTIESDGEDAGTNATVKIPLRSV